jgi:hypothetical protein
LDKRNPESSKLSIRKIKKLDALKLTTPDIFPGRYGASVLILEVVL